MVEGLKGVLQLASQAIQYIFTGDPITSVWFALVVVALIAVFLIGKLTNRGG